MTVRGIERSTRGTCQYEGIHWSTGGTWDCHRIQKNTEGRRVQGGHYSTGRYIEEQGRHESTRGYTGVQGGHESTGG